MLTRFAPAPTGLLHLGHVANAIYVWGVAARYGADVLLRIEDHDRQRSRPEYEAALLDDLDWLGFAPARFPTRAFRAGACESRQNDRRAVYTAAADALDHHGLLYGCRCSRQRQHVSGGTHACRDAALGLAGDVAWRLRLTPAPEVFDDLLLGPQHQTPGPDLIDPVIRDRAGNWTYQFAVTVDDHLQGIDVVVRGRDLLESTALQMQLARLLGRARPATFAHHPLVMKTPARKLSKSDGDAGIRALRETGWSPADVIGKAAAAVGLLAAPQPVTASDVATLFTGRDLRA
ncbi:MAG: tRNA glutamyl-Q(34) synthetase GluQRS [Acidobacteria bacterium]|nr:tRNA glutamyl-Q(34) synthetase GluQRS [Acidobacteriota bacterium]